MLRKFNMATVNILRLKIFVSFLIKYTPPFENIIFWCIKLLSDYSIMQVISFASFFHNFTQDLQKFGIM